MAVKINPLGVAATIGAVGVIKKLAFPSKGAEVPKANQPFVTFFGIGGRAVAKDDRVKLLVPPSYLTSPLTGGPTEFGEYDASGGDSYTEFKALSKAGGIIFPYTPSISYDNVAEYAKLNLMHSNYPIHTYKNSGISSINLQAKFTVQSPKDAGMYLSILHLLRNLTKMKVGGDPDAGAPPPICRLNAYGDFMLKNVPVVVASFRIELPDTVDYFRIGSGNSYIEDSSTPFGQNQVPTMSNISLSLIPMYSRKEQLLFNSETYLQSGHQGKGYL